MRCSHAAHIEAAIINHSAALSPIVASWQRSMRLYGLNPTDTTLPDRLSEQEVKTAREALEPVLFCAEPVMRTLSQILDQLKAHVVVADNKGILVQIEGRDCYKEAFTRIGFTTGGQWCEKMQGTNAVGTCLFEKRPVSIRQEEHFFQRNTKLSCSTAPIFDHKGQIVGALNIATQASEGAIGATHIMARLVQDAAYKIETRIFAKVYKNARLISVPKADGCTGSFLAVDKDDVVLGAARLARQYFRLTDEQITSGLLASDLLGEHSEHAFDETERSLINRMLVKTRGNVSAAARTLGISRATLHRKLTKYKISKN